MTLDQLLRRPIETVRPTSTIAEAARQMCAHSVGALVITGEGDDTPQGIITDRDLAWMVSEGLDPKVATVDQFVRGRLATVHLTEDVGEVTKRMRAAGVRRLPVLDGRTASWGSSRSTTSWSCSGAR